MASNTDWERIEEEYRAGQLSIREIAKGHGISEGMIRKKAKAEGWVRALADKVRNAVVEKLVRSDGTHDGTQSQRTPDAQIIERAAIRGFEVVTSHRRDLQQLHGLKRVLATRLATLLEGGQPDGPCMGGRESPTDVLEKLSRITAKLIPLERQAHNLDADASDDEPATKADVRSAVANLSIDQLRQLRSIHSSAFGGAEPREGD